MRAKGVEFVLSLIFLSYLNGPAVNAHELLWEFGEDTPDSVIIKVISGKIESSDRNKEIPLSVPQCYEVNYIRVAVENEISTPYVAYNKHTYSVSVSYTPLQTSKSSYKIVVKGSPIPGCGERTQETQNTDVLQVSNKNRGPYMPDPNNLGPYNQGLYNSDQYYIGHYSPDTYNIGPYNTGSYNQGSYRPVSYNPDPYNPGLYNLGFYKPDSYNSIASASVYPKSENIYYEPGPLNRQPYSYFSDLDINNLKRKYSRRPLSKKKHRPSYITNYYDYDYY